MDNRESLLVRNATVVAIAGAAAGLAGGLVAGYMRRRHSTSRASRIPLDTKSLQEKLKNVPESTRHDVESVVKVAKARGKEAREVTKRAKVSGKTLSETVTDALHRGAELAGSGLEQAIEESTKSVGPLAEELGVTSSKAAKKKRKQWKQAAAKMVEDLEAKGKAGREELTTRGHELRERAETGFHDADAKARETIEHRVKPAIEKASASAAVGAADARERIEREAHQLEHRLHEARPRIEQSTDHYARRASEFGDGVRMATESRVQEAERSIHRGAEQARQVAHDAGASARSGTKDVSLLLIWIGIAAALVYMALMNEEQRRRMRELATSAFNEGAATIRDIRGENAEFNAE